MTIKHLTNLAKEAYHYSKAHLLKSSESAIKLVECSPKGKNFKFAENLLLLKNNNLKCNSKHYRKKLQKNLKLKSKLCGLSFKLSEKCVLVNSKISRDFMKVILETNKNPSKNTELHANERHLLVDQLKTMMGTKTIVH